LDGSNIEFNISPLGNGLPRAVPYMLQDVSVDEIMQILESGELPDIDQINQLYLAVGVGSAIFSHTTEGNAEFDMWENVSMTNSSGDMTTLRTQWLLSNSPITSIQGETDSHPTVNYLSGDAYPNPCNSVTIVPIQLASGTVLSLQLYNILGQEVHKMDAGYLDPGFHSLGINLGDTNLGSGLYYYTLLSRERQVGSGSFVYLK
ncbi:MAG: T9SS type A sorting domain-containing protein, partial [Candidatus Marinimicrobia bacterium]|nr:T9SS type A sorting domain-containing protein [Candidatus Neomarinimicrobiota bacterium]